MTRGDGGKGSSRRKEDVRAISDNWDKIFGGNKQKKEQQTMIDEHEHDADDDIEQEYDDTCTWCGGCGEGDYDGASCRHCHGTGVEPIEGTDDDYV